MRTARIVEECGACYHVMSRVIDRRMILDDGEKERLVELMRKMAAFSGIQILTFAILDNHFHGLLYVPVREEVGDEDFIRRMAFLYEKQVVKGHREELARLRAEGGDAEAYKAGFTYRMYDLSEFVKTVKQRFTQSYNRRHGRKGTLWEERFKSLVVQPPTSGRQCSASMMTATAAVGLYIDLNAVRAGIVDDPKDFRFCGYAQAVAGHRESRRGIQRIVGSIGGDRDWESTAAIYRQLLYVRGECNPAPESDGATPRGFSNQSVRDVLASGGTLSMAQVLRCQVRYFADGAILGSKDYVDEVFRRHRGFFSPKRQSGPRPMRGAQWNELCTARRLRLNVITPSAMP